MHAEKIFADNQVTISRIVLDPGEEIREDTNYRQTETIIILRGEIAVRYSSPLALMPGSKLGEPRYLAEDEHHSPASCFVPQGSLRSIRNDSRKLTAEFIRILRRVS